VSLSFYPLKTEKVTLFFDLFFLIENLKQKRPVSPKRNGSLVP